MNRTFTVTLADIPEPPTDYMMSVQPVGELQRIGRFFYRFLGLVRG